MQATVKNGARSGRGFSLPELKEVGLDPRTARKHGVPTDVWRTTKYEVNVEQLKAAAKSIKEAPRKEVKKQEVAQRPQTARKTTKPEAKKKTKGKKQKKKSPQKQKTKKSRSKK